ncbi:MAG: cation transporter [Pseudoxanthomonas suwonensis]|nr:cation transporter [Pseudoxanthomonas suwonensis]
MKFKVEGMTCGHCERAVRKVLADAGGRAEVDLDAGTVDVEGVAEADARRAIESEGYRVVARVDAAG